MDKNAEYRAHAQECARLSDETIISDDKRAWLSLSNSWLRMIPVADRTPAELYRGGGASRAFG